MGCEKCEEPVVSGGGRKMEIRWTLVWKCPGRFLHEVKIKPFLIFLAFAFVCVGGTLLRYDAICWEVNPCILLQFPNHPIRTSFSKTQYLY